MASNWLKKLLIGVELRRINIYAIFYTRNVWLCVFVCACVCVCVRNVCVWCVWCMCVSVSVCVCVILLLCTIKCTKNVWCVYYTRACPLTLTHSCLHALVHLHAYTHAHAFHTLKEWICVDYNSTQFDSFWVNWSCTAPIQCNSI